MVLKVTAHSHVRVIIPNHFKIRSAKVNTCSTLTSSCVWGEGADQLRRALHRDLTTDLARAVTVAGWRGLIEDLELTDEAIGVEAAGHHRCARPGSGVGVATLD